MNSEYQHGKHPERLTHWISHCADGKTEVTQWVSGKVSLESTLPNTVTPILYSEHMFASDKPQMLVVLLLH